MSTHSSEQGVHGLKRARAVRVSSGTRWDFGWISNLAATAIRRWLAICLV